jgi:hypothetical protein
MASVSDLGLEAVAVYRHALRGTIAKRSGPQRAAGRALDAQLIPLELRAGSCDAAECSAGSVPRAATSGWAERALMRRGDQLAVARGTDLTAAVGRTHWARELLLDAACERRTCVNDDSHVGAAVIGAAARRSRPGFWPFGCRSCGQLTKALDLRRPQADPEPRA